jgi:signal peptidase I
VTRSLSARLLRARRVAVLATAGAGLLASAALGLGPRTGAYQTLTVLSGSMRPTVPPGAVVVVTPVALKEVRVGDVLTYLAPVPPHQTVTHRVVEVLEAGPQPVVRTKGDANPEPDPWVARLGPGRGWRLRMVVPRAGYVLQALQRPWLRRATVIVLPAAMALAWLVELWLPRADDDGGARRAPRARRRRSPRAGPVSDRGRRAELVGALVLAQFALAPRAAATFTAAAPADHTISSATLAAPTGPATADGPCTPAMSASVVVSWTRTTSTWADGYEVLSSLTSGGPYTAAGAVSGQASESLTVGGLLFDTTYHFVVRATRGSWRSPATPEASETTPSALCL